MNIKGILFGVVTRSTTLRRGEHSLSSIHTKQHNSSYFHMEEMRHVGHPLTAPSE